MGPPGPGRGSRTPEHFTGLEPTTCQCFPHSGHLHSHEGETPSVAIALTMESKYCEKGTLIPVLKMASQNPEK